jgi:glycosyltransferase involved in cell wall biosynthesis
MRWANLGDWGKINVVRCSVATHFLTADEPLPPPDTARLVCVARLSAQKGLPLLIDAAAGLAARRDFVLDIIGEGEDRAMIEAQIADLGVGERVKLLGSRSPDEVRQALEASRAFVLPSFAEGLPVVLMEALAVGRPVVATAIAGIPELVDDSTGWLIPSGSVADLAKAMEAALDTPPERLGAMGKAGRARVLAMHHPDTNASVLAGLLRTAASN